jgi:DNA-binding winged helix-turn-helix (wHTH) protein
VLVTLLRRAVRLVMKRALLDLVWPESVVEEGILAVHISTLRRALGGGERRPLLSANVLERRFTGTDRRRELARFPLDVR